MNYQNLCLNCMQEKKNEFDECPHCGFDIKQYSAPNGVLLPFTILSGHYLVGKPLWQDRFGIMYAAMELSAEKRVYIREYFDRQRMRRSTRFPERVRVISDLPEINQLCYNNMQMFLFSGQKVQKHANGQGMLPVLDLFEENGTAYMVQEYCEGSIKEMYGSPDVTACLFQEFYRTVSLRQYVQKMGGRMALKDAIEILRPVCDSVEVLHHSKALHANITPDQILVDRAGKAWICNASRAFCMEGEYVPEQRIPGMPPEDKMPLKYWGPWSDVYELAAVIYFCLSGSLPEAPDGIQVLPLGKMGVKIQPNAERVLMKALAVDPKERYDSPRTFLMDLELAAYAGNVQGIQEATTVTGRDNVAAGAGHPMKSSGSAAMGTGGKREENHSAATKKKSRLPVILAVVLAVAVIAAAAVLIAVNKDKDENKDDGSAVSETVETSEVIQDSDENHLPVVEEIPQLETAELYIPFEEENDAQDEPENNQQQNDSAPQNEEQQGYDYEPTEFVSQNGEKDHTVMVYMVGSNLESENGAASMDILEMLGSGVDFDRSNVIVYTGGSEEWLLGMPNYQNTVLELGDGEEMLVEVGSTEYAENMGDAKTLADFLNFCYENYPANNYELICWNHGNGPVFGFGNDELYGYDSLVLTEMRDALEQTYFSEGKKLAWVGFDACLMASIELADLWSDYADYLIASQETEPGYGWDYSFLSILNETSDPMACAAHIIDTYEDFYAGQQTDFYNPDLTLSCMDLSQVDTTLEKMDALFGQMSVGLENGSYPLLARERDDSKRYGMAATNGKGNSLDLIDMGDMAENLRAQYPDEASALLTQIGNLVTYEYSNVSDASGVSIYYPYDNKDYYAYGGQDICENLSGSIGYRDYIRAFSDIWLNGESEVDWSLRSAIINIEKDELTMELTKEQQMNYSSAYYTVLWESAEGVYTPVLLECEIEPDDNGVLHVDLAQELVYAMTDSEGSSSIWPVKQIEHGTQESDYVTYGTRVISGWDDYFGNGGSESVTVSFSMPEGSEEIVIRNVEKAETEEGVFHSGKNDISIENWGFLMFNFSRFIPTYDIDGNLLPYSEWDSDGWSMSCGMPMESSFRLEKGSSTADMEHYICQIIVEDINGNRYASEIMDLKDNEDISLGTMDTDQGTIEFISYEDHAVLNSYSGTDSAIEVPEQFNGKTVTEIADQAFAENETLTSIVVPDSVERIGGYAFSGCTALKDIRLPEGLKSLYFGTFYACTALEEVELPKSLEYIGIYVFEYCPALKKLTIPASVKKILPGAFAGCTALKQLEVSAENEAYCMENGVLFNKEKTQLVAASAAVEGVYTVPDGVTEICKYAFAKNANLTEIQFADSVTEIDDFAFFDTTGLTEIYLPSGTQRIGNGAFGRDPFTDFGLELDSIFDDSDEQQEPEIMGEVYFGKDLKAIGERAFDGLKCLKYTVDPENEYYSSKDGFLLNKDGDVLVYCPTGLSGSVTLPEGITSMKRRSFYNCDDITELILPESMYAITNTIFFPTNLERLVVGKNVAVWENVENLSSVVEVVISEENPYFKMQDGVLFNKDMTEILMYPQKSEEYRYEIPDSVKKISKDVFGGNKLKEVVIPASVEVIEDEAFSDLWGLLNITVAEDNPYYMSEDGILYNKEGTRSLCCPVARTGTVSLREGTQVVGTGTFGLSVEADTIIFPEGILEIEAGNLYGIGGWEDVPVDVYLPDSVKVISSEFMDGTTNVIVHCSRGSVADQFAVDHGFDREYE